MISSIHNNCLGCSCGWHWWMMQFLSSFQCIRKFTLAEKSAQGISKHIYRDAQTGMINVSIPPQILPTPIYLLSAGRQTGNWFVTHGARHTQPHKAERGQLFALTQRAHTFFHEKATNHLWPDREACVTKILSLFSKKEICTQNGSTFCSAHVEKKPGSSRGGRSLWTFIFFFIPSQARHKDSALCDGLDEARFLVNSPSATLWYGLNRSRLHPHYTQTE